MFLVAIRMAAFSTQKKPMTKIQTLHSVNHTRRNAQRWVHPLPSVITDCPQLLSIAVPPHLADKYSRESMDIGESNAAKWRLGVITLQQGYSLLVGSKLSQKRFIPRIVAASEHYVLALRAVKKPFHIF
jgi:hypothetical protein